MGAALSCIVPEASVAFPSDRASISRELLALARAGNYHRFKVREYIRGVGDAVGVRFKRYRATRYGFGCLSVLLTGVVPVDVQALVDTLSETSREFNEHRGSFLNFRDKYGRTPLILASKGRHTGHRGVVELLIALGADLDAAHGPNRMTALHTAVAYRRIWIASLLVRSGASPFVETAAGLTAHDMVVREGLDLDLLRLIEGRGVYAGWVEMRVRRYRRPWERRWVVVTQRLCYGADMSDRPNVRVMLTCYRHQSTFGAVCRTWVCGAQATGAGTLVKLALAPGVRKPKGSRCRWAGELGGRWVLEFRAATGDGQAAMQEFTACLNWAAGLGAGEGRSGVPAVPAVQAERQQHWATEPPGYLAGPEASDMSLTSTASTFESQGSELIPAIGVAGEGCLIQTDGCDENDGSRDNHVGNECLICLDRKVVYVYCHARDGATGCAVACEECNSKYESNVCPVCRRIITSRVKVYGL